MLKKILFTLIGLIVLVLLSAIILPVVFKDDIFKIVKEEINNNVNAKVDFGDFGLTLFKNFPDFTLSIEQVKVEGVGTFEGVELASIGSLEVTVDLMSAIGGENIEVVSFGLVNPSIHLKVLEDGTANYDIAKEGDATATEEPEAEESTGASPGLSLQEYYIENANVIFDDAQGGLYARIENLTHRGNGDFTEDIVALATRTTAEAITYKMDGITYLNAVRTDITFNLEMDMPNSKYTFKENEVNLNELGLAFDGYVQMPGEDIDMDLRFEARQTEFKSILSLVPGVYTQDFAAVQTGGKLALQGNAKGTYSEGSLPAFEVGLQISDAHFKYPDLPKSAENIQVDLKVQNKDGVEDHTVIDVNTFHVELAGNPLDVQLHLRTPISDPYIDATIQSQLNLASLKDVVPMEEGQSYSGSVTMDVRLKGNQSAIDNEQYEQFDAQGKVIVLDIDYQDPELPYAMNVEKAYMDFSPQYVELSSFAATVGKSDFAADGRIDNLIAYVLSDDDLSGTFNLRSKLIDLNEFVTEEAVVEEEAAAAEAVPEEAIAVIEVPGNINFEMTARIDQMLYDKLEMNDVYGGVTIKDKRVALDEFSMNTLDGKLIVNGAYDTQVEGQPKVDFLLDIARFDIAKSYEAFNTIQTLAPAARLAKGSYSARTTLKTDLDGNMEPVYPTLFGEGQITTHDVVLENEEGLLAKVGKVLKTDKFNRMELNNVDIAFTIEEGKVNVDPFDFSLGNGKGVLSGSTTFDQTIDYVMNVDLPMADLGGAANQAVSGLLGQVSKAGLNVKTPDRIKMDVLIQGAMSDPKITPRLTGSEGGGATDQAKAIATEKVDEAKEKVKEEVDKKKEELAKKIMDDANKQAEKIRSEAKSAADKVRKEGYANAKKIEDKAKNPLAKKAAKVAADKARKKADKTADGIIAEGNKKADGVIAEAQKKADNL